MSGYCLVIYGITLYFCLATSRLQKLKCHHSLGRARNPASFITLRNSIRFCRSASLIFPFRTSSLSCVIWASIPKWSTLVPHRQGLSERILNVDVYRQSVVVKSAATVRVGDVFVFGCSFHYIPHLFCTDIGRAAS